MLATDGSEDADLAAQAAGDNPNEQRLAARQREVEANRDMLWAEAEERERLLAEAMAQQ